MSFARLRGEGRAPPPARGDRSCTSAGTSRSRSSAIAALCRAEGIFLIEDCAHAHGAAWHGRRPGTWGDAGVWSFYATKTISTGEGGMLVSRDPELLEFARAFRNYGKPDHAVAGAELPPERVHRRARARADRAHGGDRRVEERGRARAGSTRCIPAACELPDGMVSGLYKYIVFDPIERSTGKVYDAPCHRIMGHPATLPNSDWVAEHHWCVPLYYRPGERSSATGRGRPRDRLQHARQRGDRAPPAARRAVVVGVVQQQDVAGAHVARRPSRRSRRAWRAASSRAPSATTAAASSRGARTACSAGHE